MQLRIVILCCSCVVLACAMGCAGPGGGAPPVARGSDTRPAHVAAESRVGSFPAVVAEAPAPRGFAGALSQMRDHVTRSHDTAAWKKAFESDDAVAYGVAGGLIALAAAYDDDIRDEFARSHPVGEARHLDDWFVVGLPLVVGAALSLDPPSGRDARGDDLAAFAETMLITGAAVGGLKLAVDRDRPNEEAGDSFPSGHAAFAFATAAFVDHAYADSLGWKASVPAYALATFVGLSRIERRKHWASDVAAGAAIGFLVGNVVGSSHYGEEGMNRRLTITPVVTPGAVAIVANFRF